MFCVLQKPVLCVPDRNQLEEDGRKKEGTEESRCRVFGAEGLMGDPVSDQRQYRELLVGAGVANTKKNEEREKGETMR